MSSLRLGQSTAGFSLKLLINLVHLLAKARLRKEEELQEWGAVARSRRVSKEAALAALTGQVRRQLSLVSARA